MNSTKRNFFKSSICYLLGNILSKVIVVFLLPLYTNNISPEDYGRYDLYVAFANFFSTGSRLFFTTPALLTEISNSPESPPQTMATFFIFKIIY